MTRFSASLARLCIGLVSLTLALLIGADWAFGMLRDDIATAQRARKTIVENMAVQLAVLIEEDDKEAVQRTIDALATRGGEVTSAGIRRPSGALYVKTAEHERRWPAHADGGSTVTHVSVPLYNGREIWGRIEVSFRPVMPTTVVGYAGNPLVLLVAVMMLGGFPAYYLYLRRVLAHQKPRKPAARRARAA